MDSLWGRKPSLSRARYSRSMIIQCYKWQHYLWVTTDSDQYGETLLANVGKYCTALQDSI